MATDKRDKRNQAKNECACYSAKMNGVADYCCLEPKGLRCVFFIERGDGAPAPRCAYFDMAVDQPTTAKH